MTTTSSVIFSAAPAQLGYLYQCKLALLCALEKARRGRDFQLRLETLDDVVFETEGTPVELLQAKHHLRRVANLSDASPELWRTLRVWSEHVAASTVTSATSFFLVTTSCAPEGSAASYLRQYGRDVDKAVALLRTTAQTSSNVANRPGYKAFLALGESRQRALLGGVCILDRSPNISELNHQLAEEIRWAVDRRHIENFLARLEGWWFRRVVHLLSSPHESGISSDEIEVMIDSLREEYRRDALPIDEDIITATVDASGYQDAVFVHQLRLIGVGTQRIVAAIQAYFRAGEQRSRWVRENLLGIGEWDRYEHRLVDEWKLAFIRTQDELPADAAEEVKKKAGRDVLGWVETTSIPIRQNVTEPFITRGSYQILADQLRVGWHPEFSERLQHLLERDTVRQ